MLAASTDAVTMGTDGVDLWKAAERTEGGGRRGGGVGEEKGGGETTGETRGEGKREERLDLKV